MDPFDFTGNIVNDDNYVGRTQLIMDVITAAEVGKCCVHIVGLPRIGKTSLLYHCFLNNLQKKKWIERKMLPILLATDGYSREDLWISCAIQITNCLREKGLGTLFSDEIRIIQECETWEEQYRIIEILLLKMEKLGITCIFIFDEFDAAIRHEYRTMEYKNIHNLCHWGVLVTCSRRPPNHIVKESGVKKFLFKGGKTFVVHNFDADEVDQYWKHFKSYFEELNKEDFKRYRKLVEQYAGRHPHLMNFMNYKVFQEGDLINWCNVANDEQRKQLEEKIGSHIHALVDKQMEYTEEQGLMETVLLSIIGGAKKIDEGKIELLRQYQFVDLVPSEQKRKIFGYNIGPLVYDVEGKCIKRYVCLSPYICRYLYDKYSSSISGDDLLAKTELAIRELIRDFLWSKMSFDSSVSKKSVSSDSNYEEPWEKNYQNQVPGGVAMLKTLHDGRMARINNNPLLKTQIDLISCASVGDLWNGFIKAKWSYFREVFNVQEGRKWYQTTYEPFRIYRNSYFHHNLWSDYDQIFVQKAEKCCRDICFAIDIWMRNNKSAY